MCTIRNSWKHPSSKDQETGLLRRVKDSIIIIILDLLYTSVKGSNRRLVTYLTSSYRHSRNKLLWRDQKKLGGRTSKPKTQELVGSMAHQHAETRLHRELLSWIHGAARRRHSSIPHARSSWTWRRNLQPGTASSTRRQQATGHRPTGRGRHIHRKQSISGISGKKFRFEWNAFFLYVEQKTTFTSTAVVVTWYVVIRTFISWQKKYLIDNRRSVDESTTDRRPVACCSQND